MLTDQEVRHLAISLLKAPTARDKQQKIGASNLSNGCDYCLACNLMGDMRDTPMLDRAWGGRVLGTSIHTIFEERMHEAIATAKELAPGIIPSDLVELGRRHGDALIEHRMSIGILGSYGPVGSTADLVLPSERHALDWKGSTRAKLAVLIDYLALERGEEAPYGRTHAVHKLKTLSEAKYAEALDSMAYKVTGHYGQLQMYGLGLNREGIPVDMLSNVFIARDGTMWFDNPTESDYEHPKRLHDTFVLSFPYNEDYALALWQRGLDIWESLERGASPAEFARHAQCFPCGLEAPVTVAAVA